MDTIHDMANYIAKRRNKGKTATEIQHDLQQHGYDYHAARALIMMHWHYNDEEVDA